MMDMIILYKIMMCSGRDILPTPTDRYAAVIKVAHFVVAEVHPGVVRGVRLYPRKRKLLPCEA